MKVFKPDKYSIGSPHTSTVLFVESILFTEGGNIFMIRESDASPATVSERFLGHVYVKCPYEGGTEGGGICTLHCPFMDYGSGGEDMVAIESTKQADLVINLKCMPREVIIMAKKFIDQRPKKKLPDDNIRTVIRDDSTLTRENED